MDYQAVSWVPDDELGRTCKMKLGILLFQLLSFMDETCDDFLALFHPF